MGFATRPLEWLGSAVGKYPFRAAGGLAALGGSAVTYSAVGAGATVSEVLTFVASHPAYPAAAVLGLFALLFVEA